MAGIAACAGADTTPRENISVKPGSVQPLRLKRSASFDKRLLPECSGLAASKKYPGVFWAISDSGNAPCIVALRADGSIVKPPNAPQSYKGITLTGVSNVDWEAITVDTATGRLIVADIGNNGSRRRNLRLIVFPEPDPLRDTTVSPKKIAVRHAQQKVFPDPLLRFDCEAIFLWNNKIYTLTKRLPDTWTVLCVLQIQPDGSGVFHPVTSFNSLGMVTDAAVSPDGRRLAILTYHNIWAFFPPADAANPLSGNVFFRPIQVPLESWQVEAIAFTDNEHLIIASEQGDIYPITLKQMKKIR
jgi:hypothetical protein